RELLEALDADRRIALSLLSRAVARMQGTLDAARIGQFSNAKVPAPRPRRPLSARQIALAHYEEHLRLDEAARNSDPRYALGFVDESYVQSLRRVIAGS